MPRHRAQRGQMDLAHLVPAEAPKHRSQSSVSAWLSCRGRACARPILPGQKPNCRSNLAPQIRWQALASSVSPASTTVKVRQSIGILRTPRCADPRRSATACGSRLEGSGARPGPAIGRNPTRVEPAALGWQTVRPQPVLLTINLRRYLFQERFEQHVIEPALEG